MVSLSVTQLPPSCPPVVIHGSPCEYETGQYIFDVNGCARKICPSLSRLCDVSRTNYRTFFFVNRCFLKQTVRCPADRTCRVIPCKLCIHTDYLQVVCEYPPGMYFL
jgi:hypothetical protein